MCLLRGGMVFFILKWKGKILVVEKVVFLNIIFNFCELCIVMFNVIDLKLVKV